MVKLSNSGLEEPEESFIFPKTQLINPEILIPLPYKLRIELRQKFGKKNSYKNPMFLLPTEDIMNWIILFPETLFATLPNVFGGSDLFQHIFKL